MKTLIIYISIHHGNTEKIAKAIGEALNAKLLKPWEANVSNLSEYDLIGFGSGIYFQRHHKASLNLVDKLPDAENKEAFIFSTSAVRKVRIFNNFDKALEDRLSQKGFDLIGEFSCRGFDTYGPFKFIGGISKGRPDGRDLEQARKFARSLKDKIYYERM